MKKLVILILIFSNVFLYGNEKSPEESKYLYAQFYFVQFLLAQAKDSVKNSIGTQHLHFREKSENHYQILLMQSENYKVLTHIDIRYLPNKMDYVILLPWGRRFFVRELLHQIFEYNRLSQYIESSTTFTRDRVSFTGEHNLYYINEELRKIHFFQIHGDHFQGPIKQNHKAFFKEEYGLQLQKINAQFSWLLENYIFNHVEDHFIYKGLRGKKIPTQWFSDYPGVDEEVKVEQQKYIQRILQLKQVTHKEKLLRWSSYNLITLSLLAVYTYDVMYSPVSLSQMVTTYIPLQSETLKELGVLSFLLGLQAEAFFKLKKWSNIYLTYKNKQNPKPRTELNIYEAKVTCQSLFY
ncbi:MAG: hypothetical protein HOO06_05750 [Bdellovibrionaceae bacterium]|jgi:hypothetical protein|nr:hypothetical protein [Pseudobdellovibrionaceae bacterium]